MSYSVAGLQQGAAEHQDVAAGAEDVVTGLLGLGIPAAAVGTVSGAAAAQPVTRRARGRESLLRTLLITTFLLSACGGRLVNTITADQAAARVEQHLRDFAAAIPGARLERDTEPRIYQCDQPNDGGPLGRVFAEGSYWVRDIPQDRNPATFDLAVRYWTDHGFRILSDERPGRAFVNVEAPEPDFTGMSLSESVDGAGWLSVTASSDCVWPNGTPAPKTRP